MSDPATTYIIHGLRLHSTIELPELVPADPLTSGLREPPADATLSRARLPENLLDARDRGRLQVTRDGRTVLLRIPGAGRFHIRDGTTIEADIEPDAPAPVIRVHLLGTVMSALLHQRGLLTLHASAVVIDDRAILLCGATGAGKSTIAGALCRDGCSLLCDDVAAISLADGQPPRLFNGVPQLKLWGDALESLRHPPDLTVWRQDGREKFGVRFHGRAHLEAVPIARLCILTVASNGRPSVTPITGTDRIPAIMRSVYRPRLQRRIMGPARPFSLAAALAGAVPITRACRPPALDQTDLAAFVAMLLADRSGLARTHARAAV